MISILMAAMLAQQVAGRIQNSVNGEPIANAVVILQPSDAEHGLGYADTTDTKGRFSMVDIAPGEYAIAVERAGFELESRGAVGAPGPSVKVSAGQQIDGLAFSLVPLGVITGRIVDSDGEPARGAKVDALHYVYTGGKKQLGFVAEVQAGDRGDFRLFGLRAGSYYLKATGLQAGPFSLADKGTGTYYPGSADARRAVPIELRAGAQMRGFDVRLQSTGAYTVKFEIAEGVVELSDALLINGQGFVPTEQWSFRGGMGFGNVPPGSYDAILTNGREAERPSYAVRHVEVADADVDVGEVVLTPGVDIAGTVRLEGNSSRKAVVHLRSGFPNFPRFDKSAEVNPDGSFVVKDAAPMAYELAVDGGAGVYLKSIRMGDTILTQPRIDAGEKLSPLKMVMAADAGELDGTVVNAKGEPAARARVDAISNERADFNRFGFSDDKGQFKIKDLPPSEYRVFAWENVPDGAPQDPEFRKTFEKQAAATAIEPNGRANLKITAISAAQVDRSLR